MNDEVMRKILILILLVSLISPVNGVRQEIYSKARPSDEGIYVYFSGILKDSEKILDKFLDEEPDVNLSVSLEHKVKLTEEESRFYTAKGIKSNVSTVVKPFLSLSSGIKKLTQSQSIFLKSVELLFENNYSAYISVRTAVINMKLAADEINNSINEIEQIVLWNETSKLYFDVSELKSKLKDVYDLIAYYERLLTRFEKDGIVVVVSDDHPFLYQEITIYVYAKNVTPTTLFIDNIEYELKNSTMKHRFEELGEHTIYAEGISNGKIVKSNVVKVYVSKIPTYIVLSSKSAAFLNENVEVTGFLSDYYGNPIEANVTVKIDGEESELTTHNGFFSFNVTKSSEGLLNISVFYAGNETYESSNASTSIFFSRFPISLYIEADKTRVSVNETVNFTGRINVNYSIPIHVFVNSTDVKTLNATEEFNFTLNFSNPGTYVVFVYFPGDSLHKPAESNKIEILVESTHGQELVKMMVNKIKNSPYYFLLVIAVAVVILASIYVKSRRKGIESKISVEELKKEEVKEGGEKVEEIVKELKLPESVEEAYKTLFKTLVNKYNLKKSLTPRELLKALKNEPFAEKLKVVTDLHEKAVYGKIELRDEERGIYFRLITEILEEIG
ncbi:MAG TPA: Ig-like domain repeat protein [Crocinitomicaceae bacterium]|nr:Ig-like domain repeat protein [Crocinitomicaceae bacterium]